MVHAGAHGYVTKSIRSDELVEAIEKVANDDAVSPRSWPDSCSMPLLP